MELMILARYEVEYIRSLLNTKTLCSSEDVVPTQLIKICLILKDFMVLRQLYLSPYAINMK